MDAKAPPTSPPAPVTSGPDDLDPSLSTARVTTFEAKATRGFGGAAATATIDYALPSPGHVRIVVFDAAGRELGRVVDGWRPAGQQTVDVTIGYGRRQVSLWRVEWGGQSLSGTIPVGP